MIKKVLPLLFILSNISVLYASIEKYTISVCITSSLENALTCKYKILAEDVKSDVFIVKENEKYLTNLGIFTDENSAKYAIKIAPSYVKKQKPFVKEISNEVVSLKSKNEQVIDLSLPIKEIVMNNETAKNKTKKDEKLIDLTSTTPKAEELTLVQSYPFDEGQKLNGEPVKKWKKPVVYTKEELEYIEELKKISMEEFDKADEEKQQKIVPAKINKPKEIVQEVEPVKVEKLVDNIEKVQRVYNYEKVEKVEKNEKIEEVQKIEQKESIEPAVVEVNEAEEQNIVQDTITETSVVPVVKAEQAPKKTQTKIDDNFYNRNFYDSKITIHTGETLVINGNKYVVKKSDDISKIAKDNKVSVKAIVIENYWLVENNRVKFK